MVAGDLCLKIWPSRIHTPILISVPHAGVRLPGGFHERVNHPDILKLQDTDWSVANLLSFVPELGIPLQAALYSRLVVDLNRPLPTEEPLYPGSDRISGVVPLHTFDKQTIYRDGCVPDEDEISERIRDYYLPYYRGIEDHLGRAHQYFGRSLLLDFHSIRPVVKAIREEPFAHFNFSNRKGLTCPDVWLEKLGALVESYGYSYSINDPFLGGNLTRRFGKPDQGKFSLQIEMNQDIYLDYANKVCGDKLVIMRVVLEGLLDVMALELK
ncbi:MAG: N-formylglutamate amidohydrolase [Candidatus Cloacimonetes bacterium]|nr:N-formylglutamate amidohydrolase [Candidatus Cloacimonadota bacterium]